MTSRTTPVGILVIALAGIIAVGCSAPAGAVFQALVDPAGTVASTPEADPAELAVPGSEGSTWWQHPDGYEMVLPAGWSGVAVAATETPGLIDAIDAANRGLGERIEVALGDSDVRVSAIAAGAAVDGTVSPALLVLAEPVAGRKNGVIRADVLEKISGIEGLSGTLAPHDVQLPEAKGVRYDYSIVDPDLGEVRVRSLLFRYGGWVYLVNFVASAELADGATADFDEIMNSLKFGV
jgi:hypothetical protein